MKLQNSKGKGISSTPLPVIFITGHTAITSTKANKKIKPKPLNKQIALKSTSEQKCWLKNYRGSPNFIPNNNKDPQFPFPQKSRSKSQISKLNKT